MGRKNQAKCIVVSIALLLIVFFSLMRYVGSDGYHGINFSQQERKIKISLEDNLIIADTDPSIRIDGTTLTILQGGEYYLSGTLSDGQIIVAAGKEDKVSIHLDNVDIHCEEGAPLWVKTAERVTLKLKDGSTNRFSDGFMYAKVPDGVKAPSACIYSREDMTIKGEGGTLLVEGRYHNGIYCSEDLRIKSGKIQVYACNHAIRCKETLEMLNGSLELTAGRDGINSDDVIKLVDGDIHIDAYRYGIFAYLGVEKAEDYPLEIINATSPVAGGPKS